MKKINIVLILMMCIAVLISCQTNKNNSENKLENKNRLSLEKIDSNERQFVSKASMEMQVKNCLSTINLIEQKAKEKKGFILKSELKKSNSDVTETVLSADSIKQITVCNTSADVLLRVPDSTLHAVMQYIELLGEHVKARVINNTDVSFDLKLNALNHKVGNGNTVVVSENGATEKKVLTSNESIVADLSMKDAINFSTVNITLQQPEEILTTNIINKNAAWVSGDATMHKAWYSLQKGFFILSNLLIYLLQLWWLLPIFFIGKWCYAIGKKYWYKDVK